MLTAKEQNPPSFPKTRVWGSDHFFPTFTRRSAPPSSTLHWGWTFCSYEIAVERLVGKYFPYGQERPSATANGKEKFATYFRDSETGLDYANNRYHQVGMGRFMTADPYAASGGTSDPGSWNRYAYAEGDPANNTDRNGLYIDPDTGEDGSCYGLVQFATMYPQQFEALCGDPSFWGGIPGGGSSSGCYILSYYGGGGSDCGGGGGGVPTQTVQNSPPPSCDDLLAHAIDGYLGANGSPLLGGLPGDAGAYLVQMGKQYNVDPAFILGIANAESTLGTNTQKLNGGPYNIYGNRLHFKNGPRPRYTNYVDPTTAAFWQIRQYIRVNISDAASAYKTWEGEATWQLGYGNVQTTETALFGNLGNIRYSCDGQRAAQLTAAWGQP